MAPGPRRRFLNKALSALFDHRKNIRHYIEARPCAAIAFAVMRTLTALASISRFTIKGQKKFAHKATLR
jgi:hypothetical protein